MIALKQQFEKPLLNQEKSPYPPRIQQTFDNIISEVN